MKFKHMPRILTVTQLEQNAIYLYTTTECGTLFALPL